MSNLRYRLRADARTRWRSWLAVALTGGLVAGAVIGALAGARRTESAYERFLNGTAAFDLLITKGDTAGDNVNRQFDLDQVAKLPLVTDAAVVHYYFPQGTAPSGAPLDVSNVVPMADPTGRFGTELNRARVLDGRLPTAEDEIAVTFLAADLFRLHVGQVLRLSLSGAASGSEAEFPSAPGAFRIVGLVAMQGGFPPLTGGLPPPVLLSPAYARSHPPAAEILAVRLRGGVRSVASFEQSIVSLAGDQQVVTTNRAELTSAVERGMDVQAAALRILAALAAALAVVLLGQALAREATADARDAVALRALGTTGRQLLAFGTARSVLMGLAAVPVAIVTAVAVSASTPVGVARQAELGPRLEVNAAHLGFGALATAVVIAGLGALSSWWSGRTRQASGGGVTIPSRLGAAVARAGFPAAAVAGAHMALDSGRGRSAAPMRATMMSVGVGVATVAAVAVFSTSMGNLFDDPRLYGWNWDVQIGDAFAPDLGDHAERLRSDPGVEALAVGTTARLQIGQLRVDTLASESTRSRIDPIVVAGRAPRGPAEIVLGVRTLRQLGAEVGSTVTVAHGERTARMKVVGRSVLTEFSGGARLGEGAAVTLEGIRSLVPDSDNDVLLLRLRPGPSGQAIRDRLLADPPGNVYLPSQPSDLADLERVGGLPFVVATLFGVAAVVTMAHTLIASVRRRRREVAVLKVLGFVRGQVAATVAWQSSVVAVVAVAVGVPLGIGAGRWGWHVFADRLGVPSQPAVPLLFVAAVIPVTMVLANLVAAAPARMAARTQPSVALRTE